MPAIEVLETPVKSENDKKSYRLIRLENGLKALLISVPSTKTSSTEQSSSDDKQKSASEDGDQANEEDSKLAACAVCINVGSISDPPDVPGMAHFLEHLVLLGSEKYPQDNELFQFIQKSGGNYNALTETNETTYFFDVREQFLNATMDRIADFLKAPLLRKESMMREREAVDAEYSAEKIRDHFRRRQVLTSLSPAGHPYRNFAAGNLKSLKDDIDDDVLNKKMIEFREKHYSAHRMHVCVQSKQSLDNLQEMVVQNFSSMPHNNTPADDFSAFNHQNSFQSKFYEKIYFIQPVQSTFRIDVTWCMEPTIPNFKFKPNEYVKNLLENEGKGSLLSYLRKKLWAIELKAGGDTFSSTTFFSLVNINITLTEAGFNHLDGVLEAIFSYLKLLQVAGPNETLFRELQTIKATRFEFAEEVKAIDNVEKVSMNVKDYPAKDILTGPKLLFEYNSDVIRKFIDELNSKKFNIMITSERPYNEQVKFELAEPWYGTKYTELDMPAKWIDLWENVKPLPELTLPEPNPFIADSFTIFYEMETPRARKIDSNTQNSPNLKGINESKYPTKILDNNLCELWFQQDDKFLLPTAYYKFQFVSPHFNASTKNAALASLLSQMVEYQFAEELNLAKMAGLDYECTSSDLGLFFHVFGFDQKLHLVVEIFCKHLKSLANQSAEAQFNIVVQQQLKENENNSLHHGWLATHLAFNAIQYNRQPIFEKNKYLRSLTFADFQEFCRSFGEGMRIKALIQGNVTEDHALNVMEKVLLEVQKIENPTSVQPKGLKLPVGSNYLRCKNFNAQAVNSSILNIYQIGPISHEIQVLLSLLEIIAEEPCFSTLRTVEQLAYSVAFQKYKTHNVLGYGIYVSSQESKFTAEYVDERIENFRRILITIIENMSEDDFNAYKSSLTKKNQSELNDLGEVFDRNWTEIEESQYEFDRKIKEVEFLSKITKEQLLEFYRANYGQNERKLSIQVIGNANADKNEPENADETIVDTKQSNVNFDKLSYVGFTGKPKEHLIEDFLTFKNSLDVYPIKEN